jgi:hypothetical protein
MRAAAMAVRRWGVAALVATLPLLAVAGCSGILGLKDLEPYPNREGDDGAADGPAGDDTSTATGDSATGDGGRDSTSPADAPPGDSAQMHDAVGADAPEDTLGPPPGDAPSDTVQDTSTTTMDGPCTGSLTDSHNCGACGHDCLNGACMGGICQPFVLSGSVDARDLVATGGSLFWTDEASSVWTCTIANCGPTLRAIANGQATPERIATNGTTIYWTNYGSGTSANGSVVSIGVSGGTLTTLAMGMTAPQGIAVDGAYVFWADTGTERVLRYQSGTTTPFMDMTTPSAYPTGVGAGNGSVYWTDQGSGYVKKSPEANWAPSQVAVSQSTPWALSVDSTNVYWVDYVSAGSVWQSPIAGGLNHQLASAEVYPIRVASDAAGVFWIDEGTSISSMDGKLVGCDPSSCSAHDYANGLAAPASLAIDNKGVYFGTQGDHQLWMMVR